jgi:competence protein ComEA
MDSEIKVSRKNAVIFFFATLVAGVLLGGGITRIYLCKSDLLVMGAEEGLVLSATTTDSDQSITPKNDCEIRVDVSGAVISPGVYCFAEGEVVSSAIDSAGGFNSQTFAFKYVTQKLNLAQKLEDGLKIYIPYQDDVSCSKLEDAKNPSATEIVSNQKDLADTEFGNTVCVSINNASIEELDMLSGVGESIAQKIIDGRPYEKLEDLLEVSGIGDSLFEKIKSDICL